MLFLLVLAVLKLVLDDSVLKYIYTEIFLLHGLSMNKKINTLKQPSAVNN